MTKGCFRVFVAALFVTAWAAPAAAQEGSSAVVLSFEGAEAGGEELAVSHAECALFGPKREKYLESGLAAESRRRWRMSELTSQVVPMLASKSGARAVVPIGSRTDIFQQLDQLGTIDHHLFKAMQENGVTPADKCTDYEFIRRATLDLTGRVPTYDRLIQFINDPSADKRQRLVEELLAASTWVDKWTMFVGDLLDNTANNTQSQRYLEGRNAFYTYIKGSVQANKRWDVMVTEMLTATGSNSWESGELNWIVGGLVTGGPRTGQDNMDQLAAIVGDKFLGLSHENCILCHDGRRHMDTLSLWGKSETRLESWQLAAFFSRAVMQRVVPPASMPPYYYTVTENTRAADYPLNTTTGNRPPRQPIGTIRNVEPEYPFNGGGKANAGEPYRAALARLLTSDIQFGRAFVNRVWKEFFARGIVEPVNQFDLDRLDPDNPPPAPWTIQPAHPHLLNSLAREFMENGYDMKWLMRQIVNSEAYQLSARYDGAWSPDYEKYFARKFVRRLWGEEVADAIVQISNIPQPYVVRGLQPAWAMQLPDPKDTPGGNMQSFLDSFLRGNRVDEDRRSDGAVTQALNLMNDTFVHTRTRASGTGATASFARLLLNKYPLTANNGALINEMFLTVLSRPATAEETNAAMAALAQGTTTVTRQQKTEDLLWALYNKVDFVYNY